MSAPRLSERKTTNNCIYLFKWKLKKISVIIIFFYDNIHFLPSSSSSSIIVITIMVITIINLHLILRHNRHDHLSSSSSSLHIIISWFLCTNCAIIQTIIDQSNLVLCRLPLPWLIRSAIDLGAAVTVSSSGLFCSVFLLFIMLIAVVVTIAVNKWKMSRLLGGIMFLFYVIFLVISLLLQEDIIKCPEL